MGYNIDNIRVKNMENLKIPLSAFKGDNIEEGRDVIEYKEDNNVVIWLGEDESVKGKLDNEGMINVEKINIFGSHSAHDWAYILKPALEKSTGVLKGLMVWEGGDSINTLNVNNGNVTEEEY